MSEGLSYSDAGVDIDRSEGALRQVTDAIKATHGPEVLGGVGGFGGLYAADFEGMARPVLVSSIDGVGTKTKVAARAGKWDGIGADIVNHCVNDILCQGARPLFFLDYFGCSSLEEESYTAVVRSAAEACAEAGCALIGGETAEMPGVYLDGELDVVGAIVGVVDADKRLPRSSIQAGDVLIGLPSNGLHTNGYSLAREALFSKAGMGVSDPVPGSDLTIGEALLMPHTCYAPQVLPLIAEGWVEGAAHITGGGLGGNLSRVLTRSVEARIDTDGWTAPPIINLIREAGQIPEEEMRRAFNLGIGMVLVVSQDHKADVMGRLGDQALHIGDLHPGSGEVVFA